MRPGINGLWWAAAIFLCLMNLSLALLALKAILLFSKTSAQNILLAPYLLLLSSIVFGLLIALTWSAFRLIKWLLVFCIAGFVFGIGYLWLEWAVPGDKTIPDGAEVVTLVALPTLIALLATYLVMGLQGVRAFWRTLVVSLIVSSAFVWADQHWYDRPLVETLLKAWPWGLNSPWGAPIAFGVLGIYLAVNAAFLQPYLGDAARYFRGSPANVAVRRAIRKEAVDTLERLHTSRKYDRIVVVAHSLGCVVAYDMLRTYFSRACDELPPVAQLGPKFAEIDAATWQPEQIASNDEKKSLRMKARDAITCIADLTVRQPPGAHQFKSWLVTDFVTLGSALSHAYFLMCLGKSHDGLKNDFARRVAEREFPTCPPKRRDGDGLLTFHDPQKRTKRVHNGALFGLTRWTNIYFPVEQIFWGDAIGGSLAPIFGQHIVDLEVSTSEARRADFFTHTTYWDVERKPENWQAPHIVELRNAVDLADSGSAVDLVDRGVESKDGEAG